MNNLSSNCGLFDAKIRAYDKDLPVASMESVVTRNAENCHDKVLDRIQQLVEQQQRQSLILRNLR